MIRAVAAALNRVSRIYDKTITALEEITLTVARGETLCIAGANGSGKSTLLRIIASALKPSSGEMTVQGRTGLMFQEPDTQLFMPTVWEDVAFGIMKKGTDPEAARRTALETLEAVGAGELADRPPYRLSGGEKQRAALAAILVMKPDILLLDEPTASLDPRGRKNLIALLKALNGTKIIATHDLDMALELADRVVFLHRGRVAAECPTPGLLLDEGFLQGIGLELPLGAGARSENRREQWGFTGFAAAP
ncbi:MAG: energy-coupling factor ABC transporter ATP-binding protein [Spirochaetaceae bacterium]|jgi:cobalt/nickel transport system ATP-binding protein|nr:energy-coupling factor ABC transporter ATP-binding protein [Spirochaetaceae bacterium]